jgi:DNA-binding MarR family transcriptional regulator
LLEAHGLTYPQYIVLLILWEQDGLTVSDIGEKAMLSSNTLTPLLKRMQTAELVERARSEFDERKVIIKLTEKGQALKSEAACIPLQLLENSQIDIEKAKQLKSLLDEFINKLA